MVYVRKNTIKGNTYYYLEHTIRDGDKFAKKSRYVGKHLPPKKELEQRKTDFLADIEAEREQDHFDESPTPPSSIIACSNTRENEVYTIDPDFKKKVTAIHGGRHLLKCFQCSTCTASCPVQPINRAFNPRRIIRRATLGVKEVLADPAIWLCSTCYACNERCPQQVHISDVMHALQNLAVAEGYAPEVALGIGGYVADHGRLYEIVEFEAKRRKQLGLPDVPENPDDVKKLFKETGLTKYLKRQKTKKTDDA